MKVYFISQHFSI